MSDKYGYIGIETLLNFCSNQKDHCVTPNDFMRMNRVKIDERPHGDWNWDGKAVKREMYIRECLNCKTKSAVGDFCMWCGADMRGEAE